MVEQERRQDEGRIALPAAAVPARAGAIVLAGGRSRRMGCDKALLRLGNETFLERICRTLVGCFQPLVVVCRSDQQAGFQHLLAKPRVTPDSPPLGVIVDLAPERGPLEGLATALEYLAGQAVSQAVVSTCDAPLIQPRLLEWLALQLTGNIEAVIPTDGEHLYGLTAAYQTGVATALRGLLEGGQRRVVDLPQYLATRLVTWEECRIADPHHLSFLNANTPAEYTTLCQQAGLDC